MLEKGYQSWMCWAILASAIIIGAVWTNVNINQKAREFGKEIESINGEIGKNSEVIGNLRTELRGKIDDNKEEITNLGTELRDEIKSMETTLKADIKANTEVIQDNGRAIGSVLLGVNEIKSYLEEQSGKSIDNPLVEPKGDGK